MNRLSHDGSGATVMLRVGNPVAYTLLGSVDDIGWLRLMPEGTAESVDEHILDLAPMRLDIDGLDLRGWRLIVGNDGYERDEEIISTEGTECRSYSSLGFILSDVKYIVFPELLLDLYVGFKNGGRGTLEVGHTKDFVVPGNDIEDSNVNVLMALSPSESVQLPFQDVRNIVYQYTDPSDDNSMTWGEQVVI